MTPIRICFFVFILIVFLMGIAYARDLAIIVNKENPIEDISSSELEDIFTAEKHFWNNERVHILMREQESWESKLILKKVYKMSSGDLDRLWVTKIFRNEIDTFPSVIGLVSMVKRLVANVAGAISYIDNQSADNTIKVVKIDGKLPGQDGYLLKE